MKSRLLLQLLMFGAAMFCFDSADCARLSPQNYSFMMDQIYTRKYIMAGFIEDRLVLVCDNLHVFELPLAAIKSVNSSTQSMFDLALAQEPVPMATKWPKLAEFGTFKAWHQEKQITQGTTAVDRGQTANGTLMWLIPNNKRLNQALKYSVDDSALPIFIPQNDGRWLLGANTIASDDSSRFYMMPQPEGVNQMGRAAYDKSLLTEVRFSGQNLTHDAPLLQMCMSKAAPIENAPDKAGTFQVRFIKAGATTHCPTSLHRAQGQTNGLAFGDNIYLFYPNGVYAFSAQAIKNESINQDYTGALLDYDRLFDERAVNASWSPPLDLSTTTIGQWIIVGVASLIALAALCVCCFLLWGQMCQEAEEDKKKQQLTPVAKKKKPVTKKLPPHSSGLNETGAELKKAASPRLTSIKPLTKSEHQTLENKKKVTKKPSSKLRDRRPSSPAYKVLRTKESAAPGAGKKPKSRAKVSSRGRLSTRRSTSPTSVRSIFSGDGSSNAQKKTSDARPSDSWMKSSPGGIKMPKSRASVFSGDQSSSSASSSVVQKDAGGSSSSTQDGKAAATSSSRKTSPPPITLSTVARKNVVGKNLSSLVTLGAPPPKKGLLKKISPRKMAKRNRLSPRVSSKNARRRETKALSSKSSSEGLISPKARGKRSPAPNSTSASASSLVKKAGRKASGSSSK